MNDSESSSMDPGTREHAPLEGGLTPPQTTLATLSFNATNTPDLRRWVSSLPLVNTKETAAQLRIATSELAIRNCYVRALLLSSARPNQLTAGQLSVVFSALEHWCNTASLDKEIDNAMLIVDLAKPFPPRLARLVKQPAEPYAVRTEVLAYEIDAYLNGIDGSLVIPAGIDNSLLKHLVIAWSAVSERQFTRSKTEAGMRVCWAAQHSLLPVRGHRIFRADLKWRCAAAAGSKPLS